MARVSKPLAVLILTSLAAASARSSTPEPVPPAQPPAQPVATSCADDPRYRALDFWVGSWNVRPSALPAGSAPTGLTSEITVDHGGCILRERFTSPGYTGESLNGFDAARGDWFQYYVDSQGRASLLRGERPVANVHRIEGVGAAPPGSPPGSPPPLVRMTLRELPGGEVRQVFERSTDAGATWRSFIDLTYSRR